MFGFLAPRQHIPEWRRSYARICQHQRSLFGLTSLPFLSYEATFLYQLAIDFGLIAPLSDLAPECCRLRRIPKTDTRHDKCAATYASAFGMVLAGVKLRDDVEDAGRWYNRLAEWKYRRHTEYAHRLIASYAPDVPQRIQAAINAHKKLEANSAVEIDEYSTPTSDGFAAVFEYFARSLDTAGREEVAETFNAIGQLIGRTIISWDCAVDFEKDNIRGEFNPLTSATDVRNSFDYCLLQLSQTGWLLPPNSTSSRTVISVSGRVKSRRSSTAQHPTKVLERWGLLREQGHVYAKCDGCEAICAIGECCECIGGAGEAATGCGECCSTGGPGCLNCGPACDGILCCDDCGTCRSRKKNAETAQSDSRVEIPQPYEQFQGKEGTTEDHLNPAGYIRIDNERIPAKSASGNLIDGGTPIIVTATDPFGVTVRPLVDA